MKVWIRFFLIVITKSIILAGCINSNETTTPQPTVVAPPTADAHTPDPRERLQAEADYERIRQAHQTVDELWGRIERGESVSCAEVLPTLSTEDIDEAIWIAAELRNAVSATNGAIQKWEAECAQARQNIPQQVIDAATLDLRAAAAALDVAEATLSAQ